MDFCAHTTAFERAIDVVPISPNTYSAKLSTRWSIGDVPHGGYILAILYRLACTHFKLKHPRQHAGNARPLSIQLSFVRRSTIGPAQLRVDDTKLGSRVSTIAVSLSQPEAPSGERSVKVTGLITVSNLGREAGLSAPPGRAPRAIMPPPSLQGPLAGLWEPVVIPHPEFRKATGHVEVYVPREKSSECGVTEQWARLHWEEDHRKVSGRWSNEAAVFLLDVFPSALAKLESQLQSETGSSSPVWFPSLTINLDLKKELGAAGEQWLHSTVEMMQVKNGRTDIQVTIRDAAGELVALASQVGLVMSSDRNLKREQPRPPKDAIPDPRGDLNSAKL